MSDGIDLGGFFLSFGTQRTILLVFALYTVVIVGIGLYVKRSARKNRQGSFSSFLTGEGGLNAFEVAMVAATSTLAGGTMIGAPSLASRDGYIYVLVITTMFMCTFLSMGSVGKKIAIVRQRTGANTLIQLLRHRFQSKFLAIALALAGTAFMIVGSGAQLVSAAKLFSALFNGHYMVGLIVASLATLLYTASGGIKSLARVCAIQGIIMVTAVVAIAGVEYANVAVQYGSLEAAMRITAECNNALVNANTWSPLYAIGMCLCVGWGAAGMPNQLQVCMMYNSSKVMTKAIIQSCIIMVLCQFCMTGGGPLISMLNPNIVVKDYSLIYVVSTFLPPWFGGVVISGVYAAIQSSVAAYMIGIAGCICNDIAKNVVAPDLPEKKLSRLNVIVVAAAVLLSVLVALYPVDLIIHMTNMCAGGMTTIYFVTTMMALYWPRATGAGAAACSLGGLSVYLVAYVLQSMPATSGWYQNTLGNPHPILFSVLANVVLMVTVSLATQRRKAPLGIYQVWFCREYQESFAHELNL